MVNGIIGTAVFILPGTLGARLGWLSLLAWLVAAVIIGTMILCFAEVASRFSGTGGAYLFTQVAFGQFVGLQMGWLSYFVRVITGAVQSNVFATYLAEFWPWAGTRIGGFAVTAVFLGVLAGVNVRGVGSGARVSNGFAIIKIAPLLVLGVLGVLWLTTQESLPRQSPADATLAGWLQALLLLMFAYGGFESAVIPLGEAKDPRRDAPAALLVGLGLSVVLYLSAQITVLATLSDPSSSSRPLADSARVILGGPGAALITLAALVSVYGWLSSNMLAVPRLSLALSERGDFPAFFGAIHPVFRTPWVSIVFFAGLSWVLANMAGLLQNLSLAAVSRLFTYGLVCAALPVLRRKERLGTDRVAPAMFRVPAGPALAAIGVGGSLVLASRMSGREALTMTVVIALAAGHWMMRRTRQY